MHYSGCNEYEQIITELWNFILKQIQEIIKSNKLCIDAKRLW